ncbi:uncharacterized protein BJ212DRAFT_1487074 [Suillus subaureus]|uniref:Uncharacterized protein n=1 Tax=Suillus subaureus TaxID=48587 RepID=A0A9P7J5B8_9AGAM|nr:uncharacterized protein BJ212DRAFT_1487074 [Suillus subaureus]KAG1803284.1 hypothetical protein BJ212DRAFT_1487074 [Suillus subaureus]
MARCSKQQLCEQSGATVWGGEGGSVSVKFHIKYLENDEVCNYVELEEIIERHKEELDEIRKKYEDLESYCDHIDDLEEEVQYKIVILNIWMNNVEWLDMQTNAQRKKIEDLTSPHIEDEMERYQADAVIRDTIINFIDHAFL